MPASYPKPDDRKVTRYKPKFDWVELPAEGRQGPAPELPALRKWRTATIDTWKALWETPQATQWDQTGKTLWGWAIAHDALIRAPEDGRPPAPLLAEIRNIEDRHGLSPKAMLQLRWRVATEENQPCDSQPSYERRRALKVVDQ